MANDGGAGDVLWVPGKDREPADQRARKQRERIEKASGKASE